jgi:hypothetical protein
MSKIDKWFVMIGIISQDDKAIVSESYLVPSGMPFSEDSSTDSAYTIVFLHKKGAILAESPFTVSFKQPHLAFPLLSTMFNIVSPFPNNTASVEIRRSGKVLLHVERGGSSPTISNLRVIPSVDSEFNKKIIIEWDASDPDGDELTYSVGYSIDDGKSFIPIEGGLKQQKVTFSMLGLSSSKSALIKVTVSDGFNTSEAISDPFSIMTTTAAVPVATIMWPHNANDFKSNNAVLLRGAALDPQDGLLDDKSLEWFLIGPKGEYLLGNGSELLIKPLLVGKYTIRLVATNRHGESGTDEQIVVIRDSMVKQTYKSAVIL